MNGRVHGDAHVRRTASSSSVKAALREIHLMLCASNPGGFDASLEAFVPECPHDW